MALVAPAPTTTQTGTAAGLADEAAIQRTAVALREKGYAVEIAATRDEARRLILDRIPAGAEVSQGASMTLDDIGVTAELETPGRYDAVRVRTRSMDRSDPEALREMRKIGTTPDFWLNSAQAVTEDGRFVFVSNTGSQLGALAFGAGTVILALGVNKIVPNLETAMARIDDHVLPLENARMQGLYGVDSEIKKVLIVNKEFRPGRIAVVLVREALGY